MLVAVSAFSRSTADPVKWIADLEKFRTELPKVHKNLFFRISQQEFDSLVYSVEKNVGRLSETKIFFKLNQITSKTGDIHTSVYSENKPDDLKHLPVGFEWFTDSLRITRSTGAYKDLLGCKLLSFQFYVITGRQTFSSAIINTLDFKSKTGATIIGDSTSGKPNHYGEVKSFTLPNSGMIISYSSKFFKLVESDIETIKPDIFKELSFEDYRSGVDPVYRKN
jgi:hypothetical protein